MTEAFVQWIRVLVLFALVGAASVTPPAAAQQPLDLSRDRTLREAVADVHRLGLVTDIQETRPGLLHLTVGPAFSDATSTRYNLGRLYLAYAAHNRTLAEPVVLELADAGGPVGTYTKDGLRITREPALPPPAGQTGNRTAPRQANHGWYASLGIGGGGVDFTCSTCNFERSAALSGYLMVGRQLGSRAVLGVEGTGWSKSDELSRGRLFSVMASALGYFDDDLPLFLSGGVGYIGYRRRLPEGNLSANAMGYSLRLGGELRVADRLRVGPYIGLTGSFGRPAFTYADGTPFGLSAGFNNFQVGAALILR